MRAIYVDPDSTIKPERSLGEVVAEDKYLFGERPAYLLALAGKVKGTVLMSDERPKEVLEDESICFCLKIEWNKINRCESSVF